MKELFSRIVFNILVGNTDDHARNHAAFRDGEMLPVTCPQPRHGRTASQSMIISDNDRSSRIVTCIKAAPPFLLSENEALQIVEQQMRCLSKNWVSVCDEASLSEVERNLLCGNQFLNPFVFEGLASGKLLAVHLGLDRVK